MDCSQERKDVCLGGKPWWMPCRKGSPLCKHRVQIISHWQITSFEDREAASLLVNGIYLMEPTARDTHRKQFSLRHLTGTLARWAPLRACAGQRARTKLRENMIISIILILLEHNCLSCSPLVTPLWRILCSRYTPLCFLWIMSIFSSIPQSIH